MKIEAVYYCEMSETFSAWAPEALSLGHGADHSSMASTKVKKAWSYTSTPLYVFIMQF